jgi:hypothetical protein
VIRKDYKGSPEKRGFWCPGNRTKIWQISEGARCHFGNLEADERLDDCDTLHGSQKRDAEEYGMSANC